MEDRGLPKRIYHYTSAEGLHGILSSGTLYFTDSLFLNDRNERKNFYLTLKEYLLHSDLDPLFRDVVLDRYFGENDYITRQLQATDPAEAGASRYFILSFSKDRDSLPMWNYYARNIHAAGYNIHFDTKELIRQLKRHPLVCQLKSRRAPVLYRDVVYDQTRKVEELSQMLYQIQGCFKQAPLRAEFFRRMDDMFEEMSLFYKDSAFSHEREVRIVVTTDNGHVHKFDAAAYQFRNVCGIQVPYLAINVLEKGKTITGVTAGPALAKEMAVNGVEYLLHSFGFPETCKVSSVPLRY